MQTARTACGENDRLGLRDEQVVRFHVHKDRARAAACVILEQLNGGGVVHDFDAAVQNLVAQGAHDLRAGIVLRRVHPLAGGAAAVGGDHRAVRRLVKFHAQFGQPTDGLRRLRDELVEKILLRGKMTAAVGVEEVLCGGVVGLVGGLNAALGHHGVRVAHAELGDDQNLCTRVVGLDRRRRACAAAADDQNVGLIVRVGQINVLSQ